jgi:ribulose kinase
MRDAVVCVDLGTGSLRADAVARDGKLVATATTAIGVGPAADWHRFP